MFALRIPRLQDLTLDHHIEVSALTGAAQLSIPIRLSPGRAGFEPSMTLGYASGGGNSSYGCGWSLSGIPSIGVDATRSLPAYAPVPGEPERYTFSGDDVLLPAR